MEECKGYLDSVYCGSGVDGSGLRVVVFLSGCNLRCPFCHNPETLFRKGTETTARAVVEKCVRYRNYIKRGGVTLSGGEPFLQRDFCLAIIEKLKREGIGTVLETNGQIVDEPLIAAAESLIVDVKNQETDNLCAYHIFLSACERQSKRVVVTNVLVPDKNDGAEKLSALARLCRNPCVSRLKLLPFHKLCEEKYRKLGIPFPYAAFRAAENEDIARAECFLKELISK